MDVEVSVSRFPTLGSRRLVFLTVTAGCCLRSALPSAQRRVAWKDVHLYPQT